MLATPRVLAFLSPAALLSAAAPEMMPRAQTGKAGSMLLMTGASLTTGAGIFDSAPASHPQSYAVTELRRLPHIGAPWTQGLEFSKQGHIVETSGDYPPGSGSFVRVLDPKTGAEVMKTSDGLQRTTSAGSKQHVFIEGITQMPNGNWFASTYQDNMALEYDENMNFLQKHMFPLEGWGLTRSANANAFMATNSSEYVMFLRPGTFEVLDAKVATCLGKRVAGLNELEMVDNFMGGGPALLGNVINTRMVLALDPHTLECTGVFHLDGLEPKAPNEAYGFHVANGIAYDPKKGSFYVTGKNWQSIFEVKLSKEKAGDGASVALRMLEGHLKAAPVAESLRLVQRHAGTHQ